MAPRALPFLVLVSALLAGCAGDAGRPAATFTGAPAVSSLSPDAGVVMGVVVDESYAPLGGADVALGSDPNISATTGAGGTFALSDVPPGSHWIVAQLIGYHAARMQVVVEAGAALEGVEIVLAQVEVPDEPYTETTIGEGFLSCSANAPGASITFTQACGADPNNKPTFDFDVTLSNGLVALVVELAWTPNNDVMAQELRLGLWKGVTCSPSRCDADKVYASTNGPSPLKLTFGNLSSPFDDELNEAGPTTLTSVALVGDSPGLPRGPEDARVHVVYQQPVTHYITRFHHDEAPADYSQVPSG